VNGSQYTITGLNGQGSGWATGGFISVNAEDFRLIINHTAALSPADPVPDRTWSS
jgi:hypothetical protein